MAGLGFKDFQVGEVLTSSDVDGYLMQQTVMRFADAAARGSALGTASGTAVALAEGMVSYLDDTNMVEVYDGSAWMPANGLVAVKHALFTGTQTNSTAAGASFDVTDLSITHTMVDASNKLIISAYIGALGNDDGRGRSAIAVADGGTAIAVGAAAGNRSQVAAGGRTTTNVSTENVMMPSVTFVYEPGDTNAHTYTVKAFNLDSTTNTVYINRSQADTDFVYEPRASSGLVIQEVTV